MASTEKTCKDRIQSHKKMREKTLQEIYDAADNGSNYEDMDAIDALYEYALGISSCTMVKIDLSTGGPGDWLEVVCNTERNAMEVMEVKYHFNDWFDHASIEVDVDSPLYRYALELAEIALFS